MIIGGNISGRWISVLIILWLGKCVCVRSSVIRIVSGSVISNVVVVIFSVRLRVCYLVG